jgi:hypothetical protein
LQGAALKNKKKNEETEEDPEKIKQNFLNSLQND